MKKKERWCKTRHRVVTALLRPIILLAAFIGYHARVDRFREQGKRNWLVLANHQTDFDQFFVSLAFRGPVYYVAMEDLFSNGFLSRLISWLVAPIPFLKASADARAVMNCIRIAREGGTICLFPEGNRTYSGKTCYIKPSVAALAKKLGLPIAIFRIEGGYGVKPRWAVKGRSGKMRAGVRRVIEPEEYRDLSKQELYELICRELWVDEAADDGEHRCAAPAEGLERVVYVCPDCGFSEFRSEGELLICSRCGRRHRYLPNKRIEALDGENRFSYAADWYDYQEAFIRRADLSPYLETPLFCETATLSEVIINKRKQLLRRDAPVSLYGDRVEIGGSEPMVLRFDETSAMACIADHKLNIFHRDRIYQLRGGTGFNALKYCNIYYHEKFIREEHEDGEFQFLGL